MACKQETTLFKASIGRMNLIHALFSKSDASRSESPKMETACLTHVRANMEFQLVSGQDALHYICPGLCEDAVIAKLDSLPRALYLYAYWPPTPENKKIKNTEFKAVKFSNLHLLLDGDDPEALKATAQDFVRDMEEAETQPGMFPMVLATDAKLTERQKR